MVAKCLNNVQLIAYCFVQQFSVGTDGEGDKLSFSGIIVADTCRAACPGSAENAITKLYETAAHISPLARLLMFLPQIRINNVKFKGTFHRKVPFF